MDMGFYISVPYHLSSQPFKIILLLVILDTIIIIALTTTLFRRRLGKLFLHSSSSSFSPPAYPIIGCLFSFYKNRHRLLDWYTELLSLSSTNTIVVKRLGARRTVVTANPDNVEYILKTNFHNFPKGKPFTDILGDFLGFGIFNVDGALWRAQRKLASHEFTIRSLRDYTRGALNEEVNDRLLPALELFANGHKPVDLQELLRRFAFNMVCKVSLETNNEDHVSSLDASVPEAPLSLAFDTASVVCARRGAASVSAVWKIKRWFRVGSERRLLHAVQLVHGSVRKIIRDKEKEIAGISIGEMSINENKNYSGLHGIHQTWPKHNLLTRLIKAGQSEDVTRDMVISFIMAGRDTTSAALTWLFWLLTEHPEVKARLVAEIDGVKEWEMNYEILKELRFLHACLLESMRLYPPVAWDSKHALTDDVLPDGTVVKAGDRVTYFPYGMGRMEALWGEDWFDFKPDRWFVELDGDPGNKELKKVCPFKYPVFQAGPRDCIGKDMAFVQMTYMVASVFRRFEIEPLYSRKPVFVPLLTAHMLGGFPVRICKRQEADERQGSTSR